MSSSLKVVSVVLWLYYELDSFLLGCLMQLYSLQYQSNLLVTTVCTVTTLEGDWEGINKKQPVTQVTSS